MIDPKIFLGKEKPIRKTATFEEGVSKQLSLNLPGYYNEILLKLDLNITGGYSPSPKTYPLAQLIKSIEIQADNSIPFLDLESPYAGRLIQIFDYIMLKGSLSIPDLPGAGETTDVSYQIPLHFGDNYTEHWDTTDVIATRGLSNLMLTVLFGDASDLGTDYTINSGTLGADVEYILLQPGVTEQKAFAPKGWYPGQLNAFGRRIVPAFWQPGTRLHIADYPTGTATGEKTVNFLNGFWLKDVLILVLDSTGALREDVVSEIAIETKDGIELFDKTFRTIELNNMKDFNYYEPLTGVAYVDLRKVFEVGRSGKKLVSAEDVLWKLTLDEANSTVVFMYRIHTPAEALARVVGKRPAEMAI